MLVGNDALRGTEGRVAFWEWASRLGFEQWGLFLSLLLTAGALYYAYRGSRTGDRSLQVAEKALRISEAQLGYARTEAEMRADLAVVFSDDEDPLELTEEPKEWVQPASSLGSISVRPPSYQGPGPHGDLYVELHNKGKTTANNVHAWLYFRGTVLRPVDPNDLQARGAIFNVRGDDKESYSMSVDGARSDENYLVTIHEDSKLPSTYRTFQIPVVFVSPNDTEVSYSIVSNEGASAQGRLRLRVPSLNEYADRLSPKPSGLTASELEKLKEPALEIITEVLEAEGVLASYDLYDRLTEGGVEVPDYAMLEVIGLLEDQINAIPEERRSEADLREHGGMVIVEPDLTL